MAPALRDSNWDGLSEAICVEVRPAACVPTRPPIWVAVIASSWSRLRWAMAVVLKPRSWVVESAPMCVVEMAAIWLSLKARSWT